MKVSSQAATALGNKNQDSKAEVPPLSLIPDEDKMEQNDTAKKGTFKLRSDPTNVNSQKYSFTMAYTDGSHSIQFQIKWVKDVLKVLHGMGIATPAAMLNPTTLPRASFDTVQRVNQDCSLDSQDSSLESIGS
jgi:hypothetical protein